VFSKRDGCSSDDLGFGLGAIDVKYPKQKNNTSYSGYLITSFFFPPFFGCLLLLFRFLFIIWLSFFFKIIKLLFKLKFVKTCTITYYLPIVLPKFTDQLNLHYYYIDLRFTKFKLITDDIARFKKYYAS
jgi:hypothetical protein